MTQWRYFSYESDSMLACPCCGKRGMDHSFMLRLDDLRHSLGAPMRVTSGYRCPQYNRQLSSTGATGPHTTGRAVDIHLVGGGVFDLLGLIKDHGFTGVGLKQNGAHIARFVHLDNLADGETKGPRPWVWTY